ncbi:hypothetical protein ACFSJY_10715 [Thalassotalea euphylliae]|uniref:hypothetical protein n=1 Tax=Thalassotalea euphylliae TaxID=1655234 RepID=UPI00362B35CF
MSLTIGNTDPVQTKAGTATELKTANLAKNQQELEGQMALNLIQSAAPAAVQPPTASSGNNINIKV